MPQLQLQLQLQLQQCKALDFFSQRPEQTDVIQFLGFSGINTACTLGKASIASILAIR